MRGFWGVTVATLVALVVMLVWTNNDRQAPFFLMVFVTGSLGALIREHLEVRRLIREDSPELRRYLKIVLFSPITGGVLAVVVGALFASGLIEGELFPRFTGANEAFTGMVDLQRGLGLETQGDAFKLLIWAVVAGLSERFVIERLSQLAGGRVGGGSGK